MRRLGTGRGPLVRGAAMRLAPAASKATASSATAPVQISEGRYRFTLPGGAATSHPLDGQYIVLPLLDASGNHIGWDGTAAPYTPIVAMVEIELHTEPSHSSESYVQASIIDLDVPVKGDYAGIGPEMQFSGGNQVICAGLALSTSTSAFRSTYGGTKNNLNKFVRGTWGQVHNRTAYRPTVWGLEADREDSGENVIYSYNVAFDNASSNNKAYLFISAGRLDATAGEAVIEATIRTFSAGSEVP